MKINAFIPSFKNTQTQPVKKEGKKRDILEKFHTATKNSSDMTDTIVVPRTIFKGYLGFMAGTTLMTVSGIVSSKLPKISKGLNIAGALTALYGVYAFVRPYVIKDAPGVDKTKSV